MQDKILSVFYGEDRLPYKDASRTTHYPIVNGNVFNGANNVTKIRYYLDRIGGFTNVTWAVVSKLPNGQLASEVLNSNNAVYDEELGEHYIDFEISSYYTTLKGDVYLSLQGYQGGIEVEQDEDTGIYSIYGTPTIQATGSIKIGVNYAPQIVQGTHFNTSDLQQVLGLISDKANISDTFILLDSLAADISGFNEGQIFFDKQTKSYWVKGNDNSLQSYDVKLERAVTLTGTETIANIMLPQIDIANWGIGRYNDTLLFVKVAFLTTPSVHIEYTIYQLSNSGSIKCWYNNNSSGTETIASILSSTPTYEFATKEYISSNFVDLTSQQTISGQKTFSGKTIFSDPNLYNSRITTNSKNYFARVGVTTNQYVNYALPYSYSQVGNNTLSLAPKYTITLNNVSGTISGLDLTMVSDDTTVIIYNKKTYRKYSYDDDTHFVYYKKTTRLTQSSGVITFDEGEIVININNGTYLTSSLLTPNATYTKTKIDTIIENAIAGVKANEFQVVEELPQEGDEGIIYLVEISSGVYQQYIWEGSDYIDLGTTQIDLSGYVQKTQTIAGITLANNISASELTDALVFATNSEIDALFE